MRILSIVNDVMDHIFSWYDGSLLSEFMLILVINILAIRCNFSFVIEITVINELTNLALSHFLLRTLGGIVSPALKKWDFCHSQSGLYFDTQLTK